MLHQPRVRRALLKIGLIAATLLPAASIVADTVWIQSGSGTPIALSGVKITGVEDKNLTFTTSSGNTAHKPLDHIPQVKVDDEPAFSTAEEAFAKGDFPTAASNYRTALSSSSKDWVKDRCSMRLVEAASKSGNFNDAVAGFLELLKSNPTAATEHKPAIPKDHPETLDSAIALVKQASLDSKLSPDQKTVLLNYLLALYGAKGDTASAQGIIAQLGKVTPTDVNSPEGRRLQADSKLTEAKQQLSQQQFKQAMATLVNNGPLFTDPVQQADALFIIAQAKAGAARNDDPDQLKDAALAYMRVVALYKDVEGKPHVADSLFNAATIEEKLKNPKEAMTIYNQVATEFKNTPLAAAAQQNAARISASMPPKG